MNARNDAEQIKKEKNDRIITEGREFLGKVYRQKWNQTILFFASGLGKMLIV